jgi:hypothetical protein
MEVTLDFSRQCENKEPLATFSGEPTEEELVAFVKKLQQVLGKKQPRGLSVVATERGCPCIDPKGSPRDSTGITTGTIGAVGKVPANIVGHLISSIEEMARVILLTILWVIRDCHERIDQAAAEAQVISRMKSA